LASLGTRRILVPAALLAILLTASTVAMLATLPTAGQPDHEPYLAAFLLFLLSLLACGVAVLRILNASPRPPWQPDASLWLSGVVLIAAVAIRVAADLALGGRTGLLADLASGALSAVITAPLVPWFTAIAVERPLALKPEDHMRRFAAWLPALLLWTLLIVVPLAQLLGMLGQALLDGAGGWFWPIALLYGPLGAAIQLVAWALASVAYRRVARS
jgi:hypothetical protein